MRTRADRKLYSQAMSMNASELPTLVAPQKRKLWLVGGVLAIAGIGSLFAGEITQILGATVVVVRLGTLVPTFGTLAAAFSIWNRYPYANLDPLMFTDPTGLINYEAQRQLNEWFGVA